MADSTQTESQTTPKHLFKFYEVKDDDIEDEFFYVLCEWFNKSFDLNDDAEENEEYCRLTITDLNKFWQITIDRELLLDSFKPSNALNKNMRSEVLTLTLLGVDMIQGQKVSWTITSGDTLKMKLKTYYEEDLPGVAGWFYIERAHVNRYAELNRLWYKKSAIASRTAADTEEALKLRIKNVEETFKKLEETVQSMKHETIEYKLNIFSNFTKVLNTKKDKINALTRELEKAKRRREDTKDEEADRKTELDIKDKEEEEERRPRKIQKNSITKKTTVTETKSSKSTSKAAVPSSSATQPLASIKNETASLDPATNSRFTASAPARNDANEDDDSEGEDLFSSEKTL